MAKNRSSRQEPLIAASKTGLDITMGLNFEKPHSKPKEETQPVAEKKVEEVLPKKEVVKEEKVEPQKEYKKEETKREKTSAVLSTPSTPIVASLKKDKEPRKAREQFLLEPSTAQWLREYAKEKGVSKNEIINHLLKLTQDGHIQF